MDFDLETRIGACPQVFDAHAFQLTIEGFNQLAIPLQVMFVGGSMRRHVGFSNRDKAQSFQQEPLLVCSSEDYFFFALISRSFPMAGHFRQRVFSR